MPVMVLAQSTSNAEWCPQSTITETPTAINFDSVCYIPVDDCSSVTYPWNTSSSLTTQYDHVFDHISIEYNGNLPSYQFAGITGVGLWGYEGRDWFAGDTIAIIQRPTTVTLPANTTVYGYNQGIVDTTQLTCPANYLYGWHMVVSIYKEKF